jgi:hypothetical protein
VLSLSGRWSGLAFMIAGLLFGTFMFFHPSNDFQGALNPIWTPVHVLWLVSYLLILLGLNVLPRQSANTVGRLDSIAYLLAFLGTALSLPIAVWDSFIVPYLAVHAPDMIKQIEELSLETPVLAFRIIFFIAVITFSLGFMLIGLSILRSPRQVPKQSPRVPRLAGGLLSIGAPLFWIGAIGFSQSSLGNSVTMLGAVLFGVGLEWLGYVLWSRLEKSVSETLISGDRNA